MYSTTISLRFGFNPNNFKPVEDNPIKTSNGFIYNLTQEDSKIPCPHCNSTFVNIKEHYFRKINCTESENVNDVLRIKMTRFKCNSCNKTFIKPLDGLLKYGTISNQVKKLIILDFKKELSFSKIASNHNVSVSTVVNIFDSFIPNQKRLPLPKILCIDEFHFSTDAEQKYCVILIDWETSNVIDIIQNRRLPYLNEYFSNIPENERKNVKYFVSDMYDGFKSVKDKFFHKATHIIDFFHITIQLSRATNMIRTQVMKLFDFDSIEYKFMKKHWKYFLCRSNKIPNKLFTLRSGESESFYDLLFRCVKSSPTLNSAYDALQDLFAIKKEQYFTDALDSINHIANRLIHSSSKLLVDVGNTYLKWNILIANAFSLHKGYSNISNSIAEGTNNKIKTIIKAAYGFSNFFRFRNRALLILRH